MRELMRRITCRPYRAIWPSFTLTMYDCGYICGKQRVGYKLTMKEGKKSTVIFSGDDFGPSPLHAIDSDASAAALMGFLCLRPGDTDAEYFADYTPEQLDFAEQHAEALGVRAIAKLAPETIT